MLNRFILFLMVPLALFAEGTNVDAVWLTWIKDPTSTICINWLADRDHSHLKTLTYRKENSHIITLLKATVHPLPMSYDKMIHRVQIEGLTPQSSYEFSIGSETRRFKTLPKTLDQPVRFIVGGDMYHQSLDEMRSTNKQAALADPDFVVAGGDIAYSASSLRFGTEDGSRWFDWLKAWSEDMITPEGYTIPVIPVIGNHEVNGRFDQTPTQARFFYTLFPFPETHSYRALDFGNYLSLILLDSGHTASIGGAQKQWLETALKTRAAVANKIAVYHVPAYPSVRKESYSYSKDIRTNWSPLFDKYGLQAAFEHHDHAYKRSYRLKGNKKDPEGVLYIGDGAWGAKPRNNRKPPWYIEKFLVKKNFIIVDLTDQNTLFQAVSDKGALLDSTSIPNMGL